MNKPDGTFRADGLFISSNVPPSQAEKRLAFATALGIVVAFFIVNHFADSRPHPIPGFQLAFSTAMFVCDSIAAILLFAQFVVLRSLGILVLANGYVLTALVLIPYTLMFPGVLPEPVMGGLQSTPPLYTLWHSGFNLFVIGYALLKDVNDPGKLFSRYGAPAAIIVSVALTASIVTLAAWFVITEEPLLPIALMPNGMGFTGKMIYVVVIPSLVSGTCAFVVLWVRRRSALDLWLLVVAFLFTMDMPFSYYPAPIRFTAGWYSIRAIAFFSSCVILVVLLYEITTLYDRLFVAVNAQRRDEERLAETSRLYRELQQADAELQLQVDLLQQLPVSAWTLKPDGTPDFVNRVWLEFAGQTLDFIRSHPEAWMTAVHPEDREMAARTFWNGVRSGQEFAFETRSLRAQDGVYRRHLQQAVVLRDAEGKVLKFVGTTTDIDDQKRTEEALRQAQAELAHANRVATMGQLTASIAHEVNQPITALLTNAGTAVRWLARQPPDFERTGQSIQRIIDDGKRAADILSRIRDFSKKAPVQKRELQINDAILEIIELTRVPMSDTGVVVKMELAEGLPQILGDRVQLQQVILNLIMNAIEAMSEVSERSRELSIVTAKAEVDALLVKLSDSGPGLPSANLERLFDAFYTTKTSGLGMGLSICRSIVNAHGGQLWAVPNEPRGAAFYVMLPIGEKSIENLASYSA